MTWDWAVVFKSPYRYSIHAIQAESPKCAAELRFCPFRGLDCVV